MNGIILGVVYGDRNASGASRRGRDGTGDSGVRRQRYSGGRAVGGKGGENFSVSRECAGVSEIRGEARKDKGGKKPGR